MSRIGDALLLDRDFITSKITFFENKANASEFS